MVLHILDASNYCYAGGINEKAVVVRGVRENNGAYEENGAPIGGVRFLLSQVFKLDKADNVVMPVFDSPPKFKEEMFDQLYGGARKYKGTRPESSARSTAHISREYAYKVLEDLGYPVQKADGYEADDLLYSLVEYYKNDFEHVYVHTRDSDMSFLVSDNVSISTVGDMGKNIDLQNYTIAVDKDNYTPYNTIHIRKTLLGDRSDNIPGVGMEWGPKLDAVIPTSELRKLGDLDLCRRYIKQAIAENPTVPNGHALLSTFNIVCPLKVPTELLNDTEQMVDEDKKQYYVADWNPKIDHWNLEEMLAEYIDAYNDGR